MKLWAYNDVYNWGQNLVDAAHARYIDAALFDIANVVDSGRVFAHLHYHPSVRVHFKRMMGHFATNPDLVLTPSYRMVSLFDDKIEQLKNFSRWMPRTSVLTSPAAAHRFLEKGPTFPFVSKASEGPHNVRFIKTLEDARREIKLAFSDLGIKLRYDQRQRGYLFWQEAIAAGEPTINVIAIGEQRLIIRRFSDDHVEQVRDLSDKDIIEALECANKFFSEERLSWCAIMMGKDRTTSQWRLLDATVGWTLNSFDGCRFFPDQRLGTEIWEVILDEMEKGTI